MGLIHSRLSNLLQFPFLKNASVHVFIDLWIFSRLNSIDNLDFVQFLASRSRGSALQIFYFFVKFIAEGAINERRNEKFASDSLGDAAIKLYKVEIMLKRLP